MDMSGDYSSFFTYAHSSESTQITDTLDVAEAPTGLVPAIRASLDARRERLLRRPIIARIVVPEPDPGEVVGDDLPVVFRLLRSVASAVVPAPPATPADAWREDPDDGTFRVRIAIDYDDLWRGCEREILEAVTSTVENMVTFLTYEQKLLLEHSPREFLALDPRPESVELLAFHQQRIGGSQRVVELTVAAAPESRQQIGHVAIVPNLVQLERQLEGLRCIERAADDGPLAPLRVLLGLGDANCLEARDVAAAPQPASARRLDEYQAACVRKALTTPHFALIKGPPGSGKTTVITSIIRQALARGERVLVVSPTHVAVDNVVEKLTPREDADDLEVRTLPVRYAARAKKLSSAARAYWIGPKKQERGATIATRVERCLTSKLALARALYARVDEEAPGHAPVSAAVASVHSVLCGTPIGILSYPDVKDAECGSFDLLIVDEVSKMTLPEFLAIAVKARRWALVGDPEQLPPYNNGEENATTLDDVVDPWLELACSVGALLERVRPGVRRLQRLVVVTSAPTCVRAAIEAHLGAVGLDGSPPVTLLDGACEPGIVVCSAAQLDAAIAFVSPARGRDRTYTPAQFGTVELLVERGLHVTRPAHASGVRLVEPRHRAAVRIFESAFAVYHAQPWTARARQKLRLVGSRNGLEKFLPSRAALAVLAEHGASPGSREDLLDAIAGRFAINAVSVYDWLTRVPAEHFDTSPLRELAGVVQPQQALREAVRPYVGTLRKQYRMHSSLSRVPRELFYFGEALDDGAPDRQPGCRVQLLPVRAPRQEGETNEVEAQAICDVLAGLNAQEHGERPHILVITPYRAQERLLGERVEALRGSGGLARVDVEVCTLDRCQGREAEYVFISLVRSHATPFLDAPKRWNVALTRAMQGLFIVGDIAAYQREAESARQDVRARSRDGRPLMSLLARIVEAYARQIAANGRIR